MKLLVRNLARTTTEEELRVIFEALGKVQSCKLVIDAKTGNSKGFAFIEMPRPGDAKAAVKTLNGKKLAGNIIRVKKAVSKKARAEKQAAASQKINKSDQNQPEHEKSEQEKPEQEKPENEKSKLEKVDVKKESSVNRNIWSK